MICIFYSVPRTVNVYRSNFSLFQAYLTNRVRYFILGTLHLWKENKVSFELCNICTWRAKRIRRTGISKYKRGAENMRVRERRSWGFVKLCVSRWKWKIKWRSRIGNYYAWNYTSKNLIDDSSSQYNETKVRNEQIVFPIDRENNDSEIDTDKSLHGKED